MIRYPANLDQLRENITAVDRSWLAKAEKRTAAFIEKGRYSEKSSIWGVVKPVFMLMQQNKCVFCERWFGNEYSRIELDLEHFRPKSSVAAWPHPDRDR